MTPIGSRGIRSPAQARRPGGLRLGGRDSYLGALGTAAIRRAHDRLVGGWQAKGRQAPGRRADDLTVAELVLAYGKHAEGYYRKGGEPTGPLPIKSVCHDLMTFYRADPVAEFGPNLFRPPDRLYGGHHSGPPYAYDSLADAIERAGKRAGIPRWSPNQLRHDAGTEIRRRHGLEAAQVVLGHAKADLTQVYPERDLGLSRTIIAEIDPTQANFPPAPSRLSTTPSGRSGGIGGHGGLQAPR